VEVGLLGRPGFGLGSPTFFYKRIEVFDNCSGGNSRLSHLSGVGGGNFLIKRLILGDEQPPLPRITEPGEQSDPIHKLTQHEIIFGAGYKMVRIDLSDVDKPR
jgi:hypothetical protein